MTKQNSEMVKKSDGTLSTGKTIQATQVKSGTDREAEQKNNYVYDSSIEQPWLRPPSKDQIKEELKKETINANRYQAEYLRNRKQAIKEILQENVQTMVKVTNKQFLDKFEEGRRISE